jgi:hypothetical protein
MQFTESKLNAAIETARRKVAGNAAWSRSVEKAAQALLLGEIIVTVLANNGGVVTSARGTYHIHHGFCSCPGALNGCNHCYHVSALRIATIADELETAPVISRPALIADIRAAWSRRFPGESLADELLRRFRVNYLEALADDMLRGVLAACA